MGLILPNCPLRDMLETQGIEDRRRAEERRAEEHRLLAEGSAPDERPSHILGPIRRLPRAIRMLMRPG
jgi:hypothetical protein